MHNTDNPEINPEIDAMLSRYTNTDTDTDEVKAEVEAEAEVVPEDAIVEIDDTQALTMQVEALQKQLAQMSAGKQAVAAAPDLVTDEEYNNALSSREAMNSLLQKVVATAKASSPPPQDTDAVKQFYSENPEFERLRPAVSQIGVAVGTEHPDWDLKAILSETEKRVRTAYGLPARTVKRVVRAAPVKTKASAGRPAGPAKSPSALQSDIDSMLSALGR